MSRKGEDKVMFSPATCIGLLAIEAAYIMLAYDPAATNTQAGLMFIFAAEAWCIMKISQASLKEKSVTRRISKYSQLYAAAAGLPLLLLIALECSGPSLRQHLPLWVGVFLAACCGKLLWLRHNRRTITEPI